jgi:hypothetical protein
VAEAGAAMRRHDDQVDFLGHGDLDDFVVWRADHRLASDLDLDILGLRQELSQIKASLTF